MSAATVPARQRARALVAMRNGCTLATLTADMRAEGHAWCDVQAAVHDLLAAGALTAEHVGRHVLLRATTAPAEAPDAR